ncbi:hypothetical protein PanWU01x14_269640, partial [Parasponia andersonii]
SVLSHLYINLHHNQNFFFFKKKKKKEKEKLANTCVIYFSQNHKLSLCFIILLVLLVCLLLPFCHGKRCVCGSAKLCRTRSLSPVSMTSQNLFDQSGGSTARVPKPGARSLDPTFWSSCQSATYVATLL